MTLYNLSITEIYILQCIIDRNCSTLIYDFSNEQMHNLLFYTQIITLKGIFIMYIIKKVNYEGVYEKRYVNYVSYLNYKKLIDYNLIEVSP